MADKHFHPVFMDLYLRDKFYATKDFTLFSTVELNGYKLWSQWKSELFPGMEWDPSTLTMKNVSNPTLNWEETKRLLLATSWTQEEESIFENLTKGGALFLDGAPKDDMVAFSSFFRSGNTLTRKYFEEVTGVLTGSNQINSNVGVFTLF